MKPLIIIGDGGHARMVISIARALGCEILGLTSLLLARGQRISGVPVLGDDSVVGSNHVEKVELVNGIGSIDIPRKRALVFSEFSSMGYTFATLIHPAALIAEDVHIDEGVQVAVGAVIQTGCSIGKDSIINTGAVLDHHCQTEAHCHFAPASVCCGGVTVGQKCHIGAGAILIQNVKLSQEVLVAAGAVVTKDVPYGCRVKGVPAVSF